MAHDPEITELLVDFGNNGSVQVNQMASWSGRPIEVDGKRAGDADGGFSG